MEFHIEKSQFSVKSQFKESKYSDWGLALNQDSAVLINLNLSTDI